jgi:rRNA maturation endonuclease Nob1
VLQPVDGCVKQEEVLENAKTSKNRDYNSKIVDLQELANEYAKEIQEPNTEANNNINNEIINTQSL